MSSANEKIKLYKQGKYTPKNLKEAVRLHCIDCCGEDKELAKECNIPMCLLHNALSLSKRRTRNASSEKRKGVQPPWLKKKEAAQESASDTQVQDSNVTQCSTHSH